MGRKPKKPLDTAAERSVFIPVELPQNGDRAANDEADFFKQSGDTGEPGIFIPFSRRGYLRVNDPGGTTSITVFAFLILVIVLLVLIGVGAFISDRGWITEIAKVLGQALLAVVGAIVGASAATGKKRK